ncbi:MAG TPA: tRNA 2-thiouridine(34) synthase MnmA [Planctomycetes bacterium]|nr:tRNA 2-thiouridine(34) synthase MnmA [Planctomycetota bacterium]
MARIVLAMSGGVDSSVAAHLLVQQGHDVIGVFMRHGEEAVEACTVDGESSAILNVLDPRADHKQGCCSASDAADARRIAAQLSIPFYALNLEGEFRRIIDYFVDEYLAARTPNPCVMCNNWIKFGKLFDYADSVGAEYVATGHYAQLLSDADGELSIQRGVDQDKDQSYVLFGIRREYVPRMMLPIGKYKKTEIRELASQLGMRVADKKDSQEICFVTSGHHGQFVQSRKPADTAGEIVTTEGRVVGQHQGIERYTIGQRKGLGVAMGDPYYVVKIDSVSRRVVIGTYNELETVRLVAKDCNWLLRPPSETFRCDAMIRYNSRAMPATAKLTGEQLEVEFDEPCYGVAPGQAVVLYDGDRVRGGGWIL